VDDAAVYPRIRQTVLDSTDARTLAEFYRRLLGLAYRPGDEPPAAGRPDPQGADWLVLTDGDGNPVLAFQQEPELVAPTWPDQRIPQQLHLDLRVRDRADLDVQSQRASDLGARLLLDRTADEHEPLRVFADPDGHPFCLYTHVPG
jgi:catechol 2,3-dioxygenase-like lactoylglutathione lyase family enzyme